MLKDKKNKIVETRTWIRSIILQCSTMYRLPLRSTCRYDMPIPRCSDLVRLNDPSFLNVMF